MKGMRWCHVCKTKSIDLDAPNAGTEVIIDMPPGLPRKFYHKKCVSATPPAHAKAKEDFRKRNQEEEACGFERDLARALESVRLQARVDFAEEMEGWLEIQIAACKRAVDVLRDRYDNERFVRESRPLREVIQALGLTGEIVRKKAREDHRA